MTYFRFHLCFNAPVLAALLCWPAARVMDGGRWGGLGLVLLAVYTFTTPWDNYAVSRKIWDFTEGKYSLRLWHLPVEEYMFFGLQSLAVMLLQNGLLGLGWGGPTWPMPALTSATTVALLVGLVGIWLIIGALGWKRAAKFNYAWHLLFWFGIVIAIQWVIGWGILLPRWSLVALPTVLMGSWLSFADFLAVCANLWYFDERQITGHKLGGQLPWEEAVFFYLTSFLVAQSYLLLLPEAVR